MPRGVAHSPELRAQVVAAVLAGTSVAAVAKQFGLAKRTVANWCETVQVGTVGTEHRARTREDRLREIEDLLLDLVAEHALTLRAELQAAARTEWLEKQSAADLAQLVVAQRDTLIRLLAGFRPVDDTPPGLPSPAGVAPGPTPDGA